MSDTSTQPVSDYFASLTDGVEEVLDPYAASTSGVVDPAVSAAEADPTLTPVYADADALAASTARGSFATPEVIPQLVDEYLNPTTTGSGSGGDTETKIDRALDPIRKRQDDDDAERRAAEAAINQALADEIAAREAANLAEAQARNALSTSVSQSLAQASADIQAAHDAVTNALATAQAEIEQASDDAAAALATARTDLQGAIDATADDLQTAINAVQTSSDGVLAQLNTEVAARQSADAAEVTARTAAIAGVQSDIGTVAAALTAEQTARATADSAEVTARQAAVATVQGNVNTVSAALAAEQTARADADSAETAARQAAVSTVQNNINTVSAALTAEATTRANADSAETTARQAAVSSLQGQINDATAAITAEATTRATNDTAETNARTAAVSNLQGQINTTNAAITSEASTRATADTAETNARQAAISQVNSDISAANAAITSEAQTRANADATETSQRQAAVSSLQQGLDSANAAIVSEANTRAAADATETSQRQAAVSSLQTGLDNATAAIAAEATTRASADTAETNARQAAISSLQTALNSTNAAITAEANTRAAADTAETNARNSQVSDLQGQINSATAAISNEANTRATADAAETTARQSQLSVWSAKGSPKRIWTQPTAPTFADIFPPGVQACPLGNLDNPNPWGAGLDTWTNTPRSITCGMDLTDWTLDGGHTVWAWLSGAWAAQSTYECFDINTLFYGLTPGATYEFSAYTGAHRCRVFAAITWLNSSGAIISGGGGPVVNEWEAGGGSALSGYKRVWVRAVAPAGTVTAYFYLRGDNQGANNKAGQTAPYIFATHWQVARVPAGAAEPIDWQPYDAPAWINTGDANRLYRWSGIYGATWVEQSDTRIAANAAAITSEAATRASADAAETSQRQAAISGLQTQVDSTNAALTAEASTRATNDAAETSARQSAVSSLQNGLNSANAAIASESSTRAAADAAEATARTTLSSSLSAQINPKRIFASATAPTFDQLFPPNVQACPVANLKPADGLNGIGFWTNTARSLANHGMWTNTSWNLTGEAVLMANLAGTWAAADATHEVVDVYDFGQCRNIVPGATYEWSAYTGSHRARTMVGIGWFTSSSVFISEQWSDGSGSPLRTFGGVNAAEFLGGNSIDTFKRLGLITTAPANAAIAVLRVRMDNHGFSGQGDPYLFACRPYFGLARNDQTTLTDWQPFQPALWLNPSEGNKPYLWSGIYGAGFVAVDDTRLSAHSTSISQLMSTTDGLKAMWGVQINTDGKVVGRVKLDGSGGTSEFSVLATSFTVSMPGYNSPIFEVGYVGGSPKVTIRADVIQDSSVSDGKIGSLNLNAAAAASANSGTASVTVTLKAGVPVLVIGKSAAPAANAVSGGSVITTTLKVGSTTIDTDTAASVPDANGTTYTPQTSLMALYTPPSDGNYTFAVQNFLTTQKTVAVMRTYKG